jgi:RNA polymerase sporulation-specific sigma factor
MGDRKTIVEKNLGLVGSICKRYLNTNYEYEELFQVGCIGLTKAVKDFDVTKGFEFSTYAVPKITGEIRRFIRDDNYIHISRNIKNKIVASQMAYGRLRRKLDREPKDIEIAKEMGISLKELKDIQKVNSNLNFKYLNEVIYTNGEDGDICLKDLVRDNKVYEQFSVDRLVLENAMNHLNDIEKSVIELRYSRDMSQTNVAKVLGVSQVQVSRIEKRALHTLKKYMRN